MAEEGMKKTENELIFIGSPIPFDTDAFLNQMYDLMECAYANRESQIRGVVADMVSTYHPAPNTPGYEPEAEQEREEEAALVH